MSASTPDKRAKHIQLVSMFLSSFSSSLPFLFPVLLLIASPSHMTIYDSRFLFLFGFFVVWCAGYGAGWSRSVEYQKSLEPSDEKRPASVASVAHFNWLLIILFMLFLGLPMIISFIWVTR